MSARIIIEKDGERYVGKVVDSDYIKIQKDRFGCFCNLNISLALDEFPPVIRTDNSAVIARLEAENAKLREALKDVLDVHLCDGGTTPVSDALCAVSKAQKILAHGCASTQEEKK